MKVTINSIANEIPHKVELVCKLLEERIVIILGQHRIKKVNEMIFCDSTYDFKIEKSKEDTLVIFLDYKLLKNALQAGEGQKLFDEIILSIKNKIS